MDRSGMQTAAYTGFTQRTVVIAPTNCAALPLLAAAT